MLAKWIIYLALIIHSLQWTLVITLPSLPVDLHRIQSSDQHAEDDGYNMDDFGQRLQHQLVSNIHRKTANQRRYAVPQLMFDMYNARVQLQSSTDQDDDVTKSHFVKRSIHPSISHLPFIHKMAYSSVVRSFYHQEELNDKGIIDDHMLYFDIADLPENEILDQAILRVHYNGRRHKEPNIKTNKVGIYIITTRNSHLDYHLISQRNFASNSTGWLSIDVTPAINKWLQKSHRNLGLKVEVTSSHDKNVDTMESWFSKQWRRLRTSDTASKYNHRLRLRRSVDHIDDKDWFNQRPLLLIHSHDKTVKNTRQKRSTIEKRGTSRRACRRHALTVNIAAVGWDDWIIAPSQYDAYYCKGHCKFPLSQYMNATNHAIIQSAAHKQNPNEVPSPCCVPKALDPIPMLFLDQNRKSVLKSYDDMVVKYCGCE